MSLSQQILKLGLEFHLWEKLMVGISTSSCCFASEIWNASISENRRSLEVIKILGIISSFSLMNQMPLKLLCPEQNSESSSTNLTFSQCSQSMDNTIIYWVIPSRNQGPILEDMISFNFKTNLPPSAVYSVSWTSLHSVGPVQPTIISWLAYHSSLTCFHSWSSTPSSPPIFFQLRFDRTSFSHHIPVSSPLSLCSWSLAFHPSVPCTCLASSPESYVCSALIHHISAQDLLPLKWVKSLPCTQITIYFCLCNFTASESLEECFFPSWLRALRRTCVTSLCSLLNPQNLPEFTLYGRCSININWISPPSLFYRS